MCLGGLFYSPAGDFLSVLSVPCSVSFLGAIGVCAAISVGTSVVCFPSSASSVVPVGFST